MRVAFVSRRYFPAISGMSVYARNLLTELVRTGHDVTMISQYRGDPVGAGIYGGGPPPPLEGVDVVGLEAVGEQDGGDFEHDVHAMVAAVEKAAGERPFDVVHAQYAYPTGLAALEAGRRLGVPVVVSVQGGDGHWIGPCCRTHRAAMEAVLLNANAVIIGSRSFAEEVEENLGVPSSRLTIIPGATDTERFVPRPGRAPGEIGEPPTILYHGRVDRRKGVLELLEAVRRLVDEGRRLRVVISGIGPDVGAVDDRVVELGLGDVVGCTGAATYDEAPAVYRDGDLFVSPTWSEGFSNTILEAMASGLPIVSTRAVGVVDCLSDGVDSLLVDPHEVDGLAAALARLLDDPALRTSLAERALDEVRRLYSWPAVAGQIVDVYRAVAGDVPTDAWPPLETLGMPVDATCRFRAQPHLL
jgi:glycogen synthase